MMRDKAADARRVGLETGPLSTWHDHGLNELGVPVICIDAHHAQAGLSVQFNKTNGDPARAWHSQMAEPEPMKTLSWPNTTSLPACSVMSRPGLRWPRRAASLDMPSARRLLRNVVGAEESLRRG